LSLSKTYFVGLITKRNSINQITLTTDSDHDAWFTLATTYLCSILKSNVLKLFISFQLTFYHHLSHFIFVRNKLLHDNNQSKNSNHKFSTNMYSNEYYRPVNI